MPLVRQVPVIRGYRPLLVRLVQIYKRKDDLARLGRTYERKDDGNERAVSAAVLMALADFLADNGLWLSVRLLERSPIPRAAKRCHQRRGADSRSFPWVYEHSRLTELAARKPHSAPFGR
jgi:hypothetical protein